MEDPDDPLVAESDVPSFDVLDKKIKEIDNLIIIYRIYYFFNSMAYRFQLLRKDKMCTIEIPRSLLEDLGRDGTSADREISNIISLNIENEDCWMDVES
jgi:hypothetical protein